MSNISYSFTFSLHGFSELMKGSFLFFFCRLEHFLSFLILAFYILRLLLDIQAHHSYNLLVHYSFCIVSVDL